MSRREHVYVIGAGFSRDLGYPLTNSLLVDVWDRLNINTKKRLENVIRFHHPAFYITRKTTFPNIEQLLTEIAVNEEMFDASRPTEGNFRKAELSELKEILLSEIALWFHEIYEDARTAKWLSEFRNRLREENAAIISFNWDLLLDHLLFNEASLDAHSYGLANQLGRGPILIKPHGSLNWYGASEVSKVKADKRILIFPHEKEEERIEAFLYPRSITSKVGRRYTPLIVPPAYVKDFRRPIFRRLWQRCTDLLSTPQKLYFLGYSLPAADLQVQFILRCGFHNQLEGRLRKGGRRTKPTGPAEVYIVNPDQEAARRIESVAGPRFSCHWINQRVEKWIFN